MAAKRKSAAAGDPGVRRLSRAGQRLDGLRTPPARGMAPPSAPLDDGPRSAYELVTRRALEDLARVVDRLETKVNGLLVSIALAVIIDLLK